MPSIFLVRATKDGGYQKVSLEFKPDDLVSETLGRWLSEASDTLPHHTELEQVLYVGKDVPSGQYKTFDQCGVKNEDIIHALLRFRELHISIQDRSRNQTFEVVTLSKVLVSDLKNIISSKLLARAKNVIHNYLELTTPDGETLQDDEFVGKYIAEKNSTLLLTCDHRYKVSVLVPKFMPARKFIAGPALSLNQVMEKVKAFYCSSVTTKPILRSAVRITSDTYVYMYLDLFSSEQGHIFVDESYELFIATRFRFALDREKRIEDIYNEVEARQGEVVDDESSVSGDEPKWPDCQTFDSAWTKTFLPQIEAEATPLSERKPLTLFFFPLESEKVLEEINSESNIKCVRKYMCEKVGIKGDRILCTSDNVPLDDDSTLYDHHQSFGLTDCSLILKKPEPRQTSMKIDVRWSPSEAHTEIGVEPSDNIFTVKDRIEDGVGVPLFMQKLMFNNQLLEDESVLETLGIKNGSVLYLSASGGPIYEPRETGSIISEITEFSSFQNN